MQQRSATPTDLQPHDHATQNVSFQTSHLMISGVLSSCRGCCTVHRCPPCSCTSRGHRQSRGTVARSQRHWRWPSLPAKPVRWCQPGVCAAVVAGCLLERMLCAGTPSLLVQCCERLLRRHLWHQCPRHRCRRPCPAVICQMLTLKCSQPKPPGHLPATCSVVFLSTL